MDSPYQMQVALIISVFLRNDQGKRLHHIDCLFQNISEGWWLSDPAYHSPLLECMLLVDVSPVEVHHDVPYDVAKYIFGITGSCG